MPNPPRYGMVEFFNTIRTDARISAFYVNKLITNDKIGIPSTLDEGWVTAVTDNLTSSIIKAADPSSLSATTALISKSRLISITQPLSAAAVFRDAQNPDLVYAAAQHTKFYTRELEAMMKARI
ncbi:hypothetical protein DL89DRAFT_290482 [Linderina pennispora]|uniref:Uncharacterized protein n=1 Tax=Linderina pennispora TaxID=61395 RepID=A0A1Y1WGG8_9FUNG|nr:uncharacterized protein DL89DRAFT_290482 [Linderina pennispora]ORX72609.1 hypothetical protein DL89DRAFT_290482 [Linderina pennispora]